MLRCLIFAVALLVVAAPFAVRAQQPDRRGEVVVDQPVHQGTRASAPVPPEMHVRNEGGSDGAGLCVLSSIIANGMYQGVPGLAASGAGTSNVKDRHGKVADAPGKGSALWEYGKRHRGGYSPPKLERAVNETMPGEKWASYYGPDSGVLDKLSRQGYPIGATMNTGAKYGYRKIAHMVSLLHYRNGGAACVTDNNFPGEYSWMPASEFDRRWKDGGQGWAWIWTRLPPLSATADVASVVTLVMVAAALVLIGGRRRREMTARA